MNHQEQLNRIKRKLEELKVLDEYCDLFGTGSHVVHHVFYRRMVRLVNSACFIIRHRFAFPARSAFSLLKSVG